MTLRVIFKNNLARYLAEANLDMDGLAKKVGVSLSTIRNYMYSGAFPTPENLEAIAEVLGVEPYQLIKYNE